MSLSDCYLPFEYFCSNCNEIRLNEIVEALRSESVINDDSTSLIYEVIQGLKKPSKNESNNVEYCVDLIKLIDIPIKEFKVSK